MKSFINGFLKREKGSLTVEASLVLPIFICAILTIGFLTKLVYTHEIIQHAIDDAANEMASSCYLYYTSGVYDIDDTISSNLEEKKEKSKEHIDSILDCYGELNDSISQIENNSKDIYENVSNGKINEVSDLVDGIISQGENISGNVNDAGAVIKDIANDPKGEMISLAALIAKEGYDTGKTAVGNTLIRHYIKKHGLTDDRLKSLSIDGLDFSSSTYFQDNEDIDVIVKYNVSIPLPIRFINNIHIVQRSAARAWMGGEDGPSEAEIGEEDTDDKDDEESKDETIKVYVSSQGSSYHRFGCFHIFKEIESLDLKHARKLGLKQCEKCKPPSDSDGKYTVFKSKKSDDGKYHREGCNYLFKEVKEIDLEEARGKYSPCRTCKPPK